MSGFDLSKKVPLCLENVFFRRKIELTELISHPPCGGEEKSHADGMES